MLTFFTLFLRAWSVGGSSAEQTIEALRRENQLLRELVNIQNVKLLSLDGPPGDYQLAAVPGARPISPTWSTSLYESTYTTLVTLPVNTEVPLTLNGRLITSTIVDFETKETVATSILTTSVLVQPTVTAPTFNPVASKGSDAELITEESTTVSLEPAPATLLPASLAAATPRLRKPSQGRPSINTAPLGADAARLVGQAARLTGTANSFRSGSSGGGSFKKFRFKRAEVLPSHTFVKSSNASGSGASTNLAEAPENNKHGDPFNPPLSSTEEEKTSASRKSTREDDDDDDYGVRIQSVEIQSGMNRASH